MPVPDDVRERYIDLLALVYGSVPWGSIHTRHNAWDIWNHRVRFAATRATLGEMLSRLANQFGLQSLPEEAIRLATELQAHETDLLILTCQEHIPIAMAAALRARDNRQNRRDPAQESLFPEEDTNV